MKRYAIGLEYDGTAFKGWQRQNGQLTVQGCLEKALSKVACFPILAFCAGRTDAGVHATGQIVHFDVPIDLMRTSKAWIMGTNQYLPKGIRVLWVKSVPNHFDARHSAFAREYCYKIFNHRIRPSIFRDYLTWVYRPLDETIMHEAAQVLVGTHDFTSFRSSECEAKTPVRTLNFIRVERKQEEVIVTVQANAFLHHMVRNIAGVLIKLGVGKAPMDPICWVNDILLAKDRRAAGETAKPNGLYLKKVCYPTEFGLPHNPSSFLLS
jgi:tRNA pseudouridine38-40 synthase